MKAVFLKTAQAELDVAVDYYTEQPASVSPRRFCKTFNTRANA
jgi:hypothetical protein